ncbi:hypothetical protein CTAYLR_005789 [Chrysophaeum taylorii]|uniref:Uncharacterized protein n=1 Tax=Chrysophaeum taylorii TaxID=2483200 RepID=A0AAD7UN79_9STRA|nr:hypothetical protein CTAYLR_005789 [Chrysophaeum taylorii]
MGLRSDFAKLQAEDSSDEEDVASAKNLAALRGQKGATTWKTSEVKEDSPPGGCNNVVGFRAGTHVSTVASGAQGSAVDDRAYTAYGAKMEAALPYEGPEIAKPEVVVPEVYSKPPALPPGRLSLVEELNAARTDPPAYARKLEQFRPFYDGLTFHARSGPRSTNEGIEGYSRVVKWLYTQKPRGPLKRVEGLDEAAGGKDSGKIEGLRVDLRADGLPDEAMLDLLICDGDKMRLARNRIFDARLTRCGEKDNNLVLAQTFRPHLKPGKFEYEGKLPVRDEAFLEVLLALPEPLPNDLMKHIKAGAKAKYGGRGRGAAAAAPPERERERERREAETMAAEGRAFRRDGSACAPYAPSGDVSELERRLSRMEGAGYGAYREIERSAWYFEDLLLVVDRVQRDAFAAPSRCRVVVPEGRASLPGDTFATAEARVAAADWLARRFFETARRSGDDVRTETGGWGGKKGGEIRIAVASQFVLSRTSTRVSSRGAIEARFTVALPARGRSIEGRWAADVVCARLPRIAKTALRDGPGILAHVDSVLEQQHLRRQLDAKGLCAFVGDGAILPRASGADDRPMREGARKFDSSECGKLRVALEQRDGSLVSGLGLPAGVSLICGGGFHGKSTLLQALQVGCYDKIPGDGRELAVARKDATKIRAEDGRFANAVDVGAFLANLPNGVQTSAFSTNDASGSTSQAAAIAEALEVGATTLLFDEDTCATNFMIRDERMRRLVADDREPITPFVDRVRALADARGVSSILVVGGTGDYFAVADAVVVMDAYLPRDATQKAKDLAHDHSPPPAPRRFFAPRAPDLQSLTPRGRCATRTMKTFQYGDNNDVDLSALEQLVEVGQTAAISAAIATVSASSAAPRNRTLADLLQDLDRALEADLDILSPAHGGLAGDLSRPRLHEIAAALNRLRTARFKQQQQ